MKDNIEWTKNNCVWKSTLLILKIIVYERQRELKMIEYEGQYWMN